MWQILFTQQPFFVSVLADNVQESYSSQDRRMTHFELINSPLSQSVVVEGNRFEIQIYRGKDTLWTLEVINSKAASFVWDELFPSDDCALAAALAEFECSPVKNFF